MSDDERYIRAILAGYFWAGRDSPAQVRNVDIETKEQTIQAWLGLDHRWDDLTEGERADRILERIDTERSLVEGTPQLLIDDLISTVVSSCLTMTPSEIEDFYSLDNQLWTLVVEQGQQGLLPSRDVLSRELDHLKHGDGSPMRPVQFEGKCNLPGDWSEGEYDVVPTRWLQEMFALRSALMVLSSSSESINAIDEIRSSHRQPTGELEPPVENLPNPINDYGDCPAVWRDHLDDLVSVKQIEKMVHLSYKSIKKHHKDRWGESVVPKNRKGGAKYKLRDIWRTLIEQFECSSYEAPETLD